MSLWNKTGKLPQNLTRAEKRNVVATDAGWVRRQKYTDVHDNVRVKSEVLVTLSGLANTTNMGSPSVSDVWIASASLVANTELELKVSFDEPVLQGENAGNLIIAVANTAGGAAVNAFCLANTDVTGAENTLTFTFTPTVAGTYKIQAQTMTSNTSANLVSMNIGGEAASLVIGGAVSNTSGTFVVSAS